MRFFSLLFALMAFSTASHAADEIPYVPMEFCKADQKDLRKAWDTSRYVCFDINGETQRYRLSNMGEIKLRDNGAWVGSEYTAAMSKKLQKEVSGYSKFYVRYMSYSTPVDGKIPFMAHVFFSWGLGTQTMYVFGEVSADGVKLTGYSNSEAIDGTVRETVNVIKNLGAIFLLENPIRVGIEETAKEDRARSESVKSAVRTYLIKNQDKPLENKLD